MKLALHIIEPLGKDPKNPWAFQPGGVVGMGIMGLFVFLVPLCFSVYNIYRDIPFLVDSGVAIAQFGGVTGQHFDQGIRGGGNMIFKGIYDYRVKDTPYTLQVADNVPTANNYSYNPRVDGKPYFAQTSYVTYKLSNPADSRTISQSSPLLDAVSGLEVGVGVGLLLYCLLYALSYSLMTKRNRRSAQTPG